ncbi:hypothetical protein BDC45DRAFT_539550 [Circinella umbellata]|nr:hypothetical protein BDC45DRAFT_539550 [Circinella umbellata]
MFFNLKLFKSAKKFPVLENFLFSHFKKHYSNFCLWLASMVSNMPQRFQLVNIEVNQTFNSLLFIGWVMLRNTFSVSKYYGHTIMKRAMYDVQEGLLNMEQSGYESLAWKTTSGTREQTRQGII